MSILSLSQVTSYAVAAGFSGRALDTIVAIAHAESLFDTQARHTNIDGSIDRGILQINNKAWPMVSDAQADDPAYAFSFAYASISHQGSNFTPWSTFNNGDYWQYLPQISAMCPNALHFSEFQGGYHGTCGETALATALVCASPPIEDTQQAINLMLSMTKELIGLGWASSNGSTTTAHLHDEALRRGFHPDESTFISFSNSIPATKLHNLLLQTAGVKPVILEIARAYALPGDESGVDYHFICVVGISPQGYICNDGDNSAIAAHLVTYSWSQIEAAAPCGVLVIEEQGAGVQGVPAGWRDDGVTLTAPNGFTAQHAFRAYILAHANWPPMLMPYGADYAVTGGDRHNFTLALEWVSATGATSEVEGPASLMLDPSIRTDLVAVQASLPTALSLVQSALAKLP